ncbi:holo-ACP synthase [Archangium lansingense]|uniref:4'-phosphopantetheinyl transferase superfamily protein n=1 Tax=Archangium lansingense TaxID=2995310 RepID=A0ABT4ALJ9_9BACT|nr:4'-phosphopantetheinyl transferase superfamily protein [Archangium lansinium]MCY1082525.1 4'-phosphopantetheinyl transferase superfamily protein [Archangium lansinium]
MKAPRSRDSIGCDVVSIPRLARVLGRNPPAFRDELFTQVEHRAGHAGVEELALCFAVKEATLKALGTGFIAGIKATDIEVRLDERNTAEVTLYGAPAALVRARGATLQAETALCGDHATAVVHLLSPHPRGGA